MKIFAGWSTICPYVLVGGMYTAPYRVIDTSRLRMVSWQKRPNLLFVYTVARLRKWTRGTVTVGHVLTIL